MLDPDPGSAKQAARSIIHRKVKVITTDKLQEFFRLRFSAIPPTVPHGWSPTKHAPDAFSYEAQQKKQAANATQYLGY